MATPEVGASRGGRFRNFRTPILVLITGAMMINYMDRSALAIAMPFITEDFHLTSVEKGVIFSSFFIGYALFNFLGGIGADRFGPTRVMTVAMTFWSAMCGLTAGAVGFWSLLISRTLFGIGEGPVSTTANKVIANWFPLRERARAVGVLQAGSPLGGALAGPVVGFLSLTFGWRIAFVLVAAIGLTWVLIWRLAATDRPRDNRHVDAAEIAAIEAQEPTPMAAGQSVESTKPSLWRVLAQPAILATSLSLFCYNYILFFFMTWFPDYLVEARGLSLRDMSWVTAIPWIVGAIGYVVGGYVIDAVYRRTGRQVYSRKIVLISTLCASAICVAFVGGVGSVPSSVALMTVALGLLMVGGPSFWTLIQDAAPREYVGSAGGLMHGLSNIAGVVAPTVTGFIVAGSNYGGAFVLAGALGALGAVIVWVFVRERDKIAAATK